MSKQAIVRTAFERFRFSQPNVEGIDFVRTKGLLAQNILSAVSGTAMVLEHIEKNNSLVL